MYLSSVLLAVLLPHVLIFAIEEKQATWTTTLLSDSKSTSGFSEKAVAIAQERNGNFIIAVDRSSSLSTSSTPLLYKSSRSGKIHWVVKANDLGTPFDIVLNSERDIAYLVVSSTAGSTSSYSNGHVLRFSGISALATTANASSLVHEELMFSTNSTNGHTKLFSGALDRSTGDVFLTGGTSDSLYGTSKGGSDVVVLRISQTGEMLAKTQFGTANHEFGRAIDVSADSEVVSVAVKQSMGDGGIESVLYRLDAKTLKDSEGPRSLHNYGSTPLFTTNDVAVTGPTAKEIDTRTTVICGSAITVPVRKTDLFFHVFAKVAGSDSDVPVYIDGANDEKRDDHAVAIRAASDGNFYSIGYSSPMNPNDPISITLTVLSPTGKILYRTSDGNTDRNQVFPTSMVLTEKESKVNVAFAGYSQQENMKKPILGQISTPKGLIPEFEGFGSIIEGAGADQPGRSDEEKKKKTSRPTPLFSIIGGAAGLIAFLFLGLMVYTLLLRRRRTNDKVAGTVPSEHTAAHETSTNFSSREEVIFDANNALA